MKKSGGNCRLILFRGAQKNAFPVWGRWQPKAEGCGEGLYVLRYSAFAINDQICVGERLCPSRAGRTTKNEQRTAAIQKSP